MELLKKAEVSHTTFYRHCSAVDDALREIEGEFLSAIRQRCSHFGKSRNMDSY